MRLKSYFAPSVDEAIERARVELGPEAMLLNSRKIASEQAHLGSYEVVFGITGEVLQRKPAPALTPASTAPRTSAFAAAARTAAAALPASTPVVTLSAPAPAPAPAPKTAPAPTSAPAQTLADVAASNKLRESMSKVSSKRQRKTSAKAAAQSSSGKSTTTVASEKSSGKPAAIADELAELRKQIEAVQNSISQTGKDIRTGDVGLALSQEDAYRQMIDFDFSDRVARRFLESTATPSQGSQGEASSNVRLAHALIGEINSRFEVAPKLGKGNSDRRIVMFVGPPGAGKTTTVVKLAIKLGIQRRLPVQLLSLDTMRVGGSEQLAEYARIIGVDFRALYTTAALDEVLDDCAGKKLILIDTPGYAPAEMDEAEENAFFLRRHPEIEVQLVLPASLRASAFEKFTERFSVFQPTKLLFTHLDEVDTFGPLLEHAMKTKLPVSYLTDGQSIPQDIEEASKDRLTEGLFGNREAAAVSAA